MRRLLKFIFVLCFLLGVTLGAVTVSLLDPVAIVPERGALNTSELQRIKRLVNQHSPLRHEDGASASSTISEDDLNLVIAYALQSRNYRLAGRVSSAVKLQQQTGTLKISLHLPDNPIGSYVNFEINISSSDDSTSLLTAESIQLGWLKAGPRMSQMIMSRLHESLLKQYREYAEIRETIRSVSIQPGLLKMEYTWEQGAAQVMKARLGSMVISAELKQALLVYSDFLADYSHTLPQRVKLNAVLRGMFGHAYRHHEELSPVIENQAILISMAAFVMNRNIPHMLGEETRTQSSRRRIYLKGREDLARHFLISAAITSLANEQLAEVIGLEKEIYDAQRGSGFSFADLAADHAGIRFAQQAISSDLKAAKLQNYLSTSLTENNFMPNIQQMPEGLRAGDKNNIYQDPKSEAFRQKKQQIMQTIDDLPLYKQL